MIHAGWHTFGDGRYVQIGVSGEYDFSIGQDWLTDAANQAALTL